MHGDGLQTPSRNAFTCLEREATCATCDGQRSTASVVFGESCVLCGLGCGTEANCVGGNQCGSGDEETEDVGGAAGGVIGGQAGGMMGRALSPIVVSRSLANLQCEHTLCVCV